MKINELKTNENAEIVAKVSEIQDVKQVTTKTGRLTSLTVAVLEDDTGTVKLNLWGDQSEGIEEESTIEIKNGFVKEFRGEKSISIGRNGSIKVI